MIWFDALKRWLVTHPILPVIPLTYYLVSGMIASSGLYWLIPSIRTILYIFLLFPAFVRMGWYYLTSKYVLLNITYGQNPRNTLDIYLPSHYDQHTPSRKYPVLIFFVGGAWIIGYKAWGVLVGKVLAKNGIICVVPDYRHYPQGSVTEMLSDLSTSIDWCFKNISQYHGDPSHIVAMGQYNGAQLLSNLVLDQVLKSPDVAIEPTWKAEQLKAFIGIAGVYDLIGALAHFETRGLSRKLLERIMNGNLRRYSPTLRMKEYHETFRTRKSKQSELAHLRQTPPFFLLHGTADMTAPLLSSIEFANTLRESGIKASMKCYVGKGHSAPVLEDLMRLRNHLAQDDQSMISDVIRIVKGLPLLNAQTLNEQPPILFTETRQPSYLDDAEAWITSETRNLPNLISGWLVRASEYVNPF